jgi:glutamine synthetase
LSAPSSLQERLRQDGIDTLLVQFTDVHGCAKGKLVPLAHLDDVLGIGAGFAGPSIWGTGLPRTGPRSEYHAVGDPSTLQPLPWMPRVARIVGDGHVDGRPFEACPRQVLRRATARLLERGWMLRTGIEPEFFLLRRAPDGRWIPGDDQDSLDKPSYDLKSLCRQAGFLQELAATLRACGLDVLQLDHEDAHGQYEVNFAYAEALASADHLMLFKLAAHALAETRGWVFSMMPKPFADQPGSGMHFHVSLWEAGAGGACLFDPRRQADSAADPAVFASGESCDSDARLGGHELSRLGQHFIAGVLHHAPALAALAAPTVNSYKRLALSDSITGTTWAPVCIAHGPNNRTALVRTLPGRFEWRLPDAAANPYLVTAALIAAGLDGVDRQLDPGPAVTEDLFEVGSTGWKQRGLPVLPASLAQALDALEADAIVRDALGPELSREFLRLKREEWSAWTRHVSAWELERYAAAS